MAAAAIITEEENYVNKPRQFSAGTSSLAQDLIPPAQSPSSLDYPKHVVVVMDALKDFTMEPLEWVLKNIALEAFCTVTFLGVKPWLNIPLSSKTWSDVWAVDLQDLSAAEGKSEWKTDVKYQKVQRLIELCQQFGIKPQMRTEMGYPLQLLVVEQIISLHATLVVFDRHQQKYREYYAKKIPCNMVMMNEDGEVDMIKGRFLIDSTVGKTTGPGESPDSSAHTPTLLIAEHLKRMFKQRS